MTLYSPSAYRDCLATSLEAQSRWRAHKAEQFPDDERNKKALEIFQRIEPEIAVLSGSPLHLRILTFATDERFGGEVEFILRRVGFGVFPCSGEALLEEILAQLELRCRSTGRLFAVS